MRRLPIAWVVFAAGCAAGGARPVILTDIIKIEAATSAGKAGSRLELFASGFIYKMGASAPVGYEGSGSITSQEWSEIVQKFETIDRRYKADIQVHPVWEVKIHREGNTIDRFELPYELLMQRKSLH